MAWPELPTLGDGPLPSSWWAYFAAEPEAQAAGQALAALDCLVLVEHRPDVPHRPEKWLLRAARPVADAELDGFSARVRQVVVAAGGVYEGWDSGWLDAASLSVLSARRGLDLPSDLSFTFFGE